MTVRFTLNGRLPSTPGCVKAALGGAARAPLP